MVKRKSKNQATARLANFRDCCDWSKCWTSKVMHPMLKKFREKKLEVFTEASLEIWFLIWTPIFLMLSLRLINLINLTRSILIVFLDRRWKMLKINLGIWNYWFRQIYWEQDFICLPNDTMSCKCSKVPVSGWRK